MYANGSNPDHDVPNDGKLVELGGALHLSCFPVCPSLILIQGQPVAGMGKYRTIFKASKSSFFPVHSM